MLNLVSSSNRFDPFSSPLREISAHAHSVNRMDKRNVWESFHPFNETMSIFNAFGNNGWTSAHLEWVGSKLALVLLTVFLFCVCTTLVNFTLRETQERMLKFTFLLQYHIRNHIPYTVLVLRHLMESVVFVPVFAGVLFFFGEFLNDRILAFMVMFHQSSIPSLFSSSLSPLSSPMYNHQNYRM